MRPFALCLLAFSLTAFSQDPHAADREQLLKIFHEVEDSINSQSLERMAKQMDASATVVWANGEISRGPAEVLAYYGRMVEGQSRSPQPYTTSAQLTGHGRFPGRGAVAIADGTMVDVFTPVIRGVFQLDSKWTMTAAKIDGEWKVVGLHLSSNVFNNVLLDEAKSVLKIVGGGGVFVGLLVGYFLGRRGRAA